MKKLQSIGNDLYRDEHGSWWHEVPKNTTSLESLRIGIQKNNMKMHNGRVFMKCTHELWNNNEEA